MQTFRLGIVHEVGDTRSAAVRVGAAQLVEAHLFMGYRLYHIGPGDEHVAQVPNHEDEVGDRRAVYGTTGAGPEDHRDLRYHTGHQGVPQKDVGVAPERNHTFLNPGTARIVQPNDRGASLERQVHDLADLLRVSLGERASEDGEVLREHVDQSAVDSARPGDNPITREDLLLQPKVGRAMGDETIQLNQAAFVQQQIKPFPGSQLSFLMLLRDAVGTTALLSERLAVMQVVEQLSGVGHGG